MGMVHLLMKDEIGTSGHAGLVWFSTHRVGRTLITSIGVAIVER